MDNVRQTRKALENALFGQDPHRLADVFDIFIDSSLSKSGEPRKHKPQLLTVDGKDCGNLLSALVDLNAAADVVSMLGTN